MATMMSAGAGGAVGQLSFRRIIDIPFETCVAALENWQRTEQDGELRIGHSLLRGPIEHDRPSGTCRIEVRLARGPLRPLLRMRLNIDRWSWPPARTALELIPCDRVRPTAAYFRSGHLLLDSLTRSLPRHTPGQRLDHVPASRPTARQGLPGPTEQSPARWSAVPVRRRERLDNCIVMHRHLYRKCALMPLTGRSGPRKAGAWSLVLRQGRSGPERVRWRTRQSGRAGSAREDESVPRAATLAPA